MLRFLKCSLDALVKSAQNLTCLAISFHKIMPGFYLVVAVVNMPW
jgi:zinc transporter ZupT